MQNEPAPEAASRPGVTVLLDIIVAPARAFATIAARRPVLLAICVAVACTIAATFLTLPAQLHIGGIKVIAKSGWFAARPSGTENICKVYAESFQGADHLRRILEEAQTIVGDALAAVPVPREKL